MVRFPPQNSHDTFCPPISRFPSVFCIFYRDFKGSQGQRKPFVFLRVLLGCSKRPRKKGLGVLN